MEAFLAHVTLVGKVLGVNGDDVPLQVTGVGALVLAVGALVGLVALHHLDVALEFPRVGVRLGTVAALERQIGAVLALYVSLKVGLIRAAELAVRAVVGLLPRVGPHVLLQLRRVAEAFGALHAHVCKGLAVHSQQVTVEQALFRRLVIAVLAGMQLGLPVLDDELIGAQGAGLVVAPGVLAVFWRALVVVTQQLVAFQVVVETDLLVGGEVAVGTLVLLFKQVVRVVLHVAFEEAS